MVLPLFPISVVLLLAVTKSKNKSLIISITLMTLVPAVARFARSPVLDWGGGLQMIVICRLDALMYGVLVAWLKFKRPLVFKRMTKWALPAMLGAAALTITAHRFYSLTSPSEMPAIVFTLLPMACALMLPGAYYLAPFGKFLLQPITNLSLWSYSIYLSHPAILYLAYHFTDPYVHGAVGKLLVKAACLAATLLISKIIFEYFETPIMNLRDRRRTVKPAAMAEQKPFGAQSGTVPTTAEASLSVEDCAKQMTPDVACSRVDVLQFGICICTRNRPDELRVALQSIRESSYPASQVVVSDDSTDTRSRDSVSPDFPEVILPRDHAKGWVQIEIMRFGLSRRLMFCLSTMTCS